MRGSLGLYIQQRQISFWLTVHLQCDSALKPLKSDLGSLYTSTS